MKQNANIKCISLQTLKTRNIVLTFKMLGRKNKKTNIKIKFDICKNILQGDIANNCTAVCDSQPNL